MSNLDKLASDSTSAPSPSSKKGKGGGIAKVTAETSEILVADAKTNAIAAAGVYDHTFAQTFISARLAGAEQLKELIARSGVATREAITSVDLDGITPAITNPEDSKKALAACFDEFM